MTPTRPIVYLIATSAEWQDANLDRVRGERSSIADVISAKKIKETAADNAMYSRAKCGFTMTSLHYFLG
jgi:hypothetical protein